MSLTWSSNHDYNICVVDWSDMAYNEYYTTILSLPAISDLITRFIKELNQQRFYLHNLICVGHGFGAHICGIIGHNFNGQLKKIIGLDPAAMGFTEPILSPSYFRLDKSDAHTVVCVHSSDYRIGSHRPQGHQDIYINGGISMMQPGCGPTFFVEAIYNSSVACSHYRALQIFHQSLLRPNQLCVIRRCNSIQEYYHKVCAGPEEIFDFESTASSGDFYMSTGEIPRCTGKIYS